MVDVDVVGAFLSGTTSRALIHELGPKRSRMVRELLDIATSHTSGEEAVVALCTRIPASDKCKWKRSDETGEGS